MSSTAQAQTPDGAGVIRSERRGRVTLIVLDRPERRNALDLEHCQELAELIGSAPATGARALVLAGAGPHFCAGADLSGVEDEGFVAALHQVLEALTTVPVPVVAAVHGAALGAGTQLAIACDLRVAEPSARFGIPAARLGLMVDHWTVRRLAAVAGHSAATELLVGAGEYDGDAAHRVGLVHRIGDQAVATAWAAELADLAPLTLAGHKAGLNGPDAAYPDAFRRAWSSRDLAEGMAARSERRPPSFEGR